MSPKKHIKVLECIRQGQIGGGESHLLSLVEHLDRSVFDPVVLSFTDGPMVSRLEAIGIKTEVIHTERPFDIPKWGMIRKWIRDGKFDLIHAHGTRANSNILWAARSLGIPVIYTIHGWSFHDDQQSLVKRIRILGEKYLTSKSTLNISVSQSNRETGVKYFSGFQSVVVNNGIDGTKFNPANSFKNIRVELGIPEDAILVLFLARFTHQKQPITLLKAFLEAAKRNEKLFLLMVGDGEEKPEAQELLAQSEFKNRVILSPFRQDVPDVLHAADLFILASLWEGLPIALLEAMAMGKAIIASEVDGTKEIIKHKQNGYLITTHNLQQQLTTALVEVSENENLRKKMSIQARQTITENFDASRMTREIEALYKQTVQLN
ncbi:MAG TPA: glycosyltransferase family 4 protein [Flavisolibacter sp.]|nr:glycosyltransferase family 4 protein [Flavisolibacter sp.]